ncbi:Type II/IV secretion system ATP hydrolase TadA/VirB11/CpaF, TadA subfamily protein [Minicystis rosea]|nr:Type II/IV secretion system ATP hydrolase TadA/VirB11/CpaF, TadA subfamily protein [Minicystis rosea]
MVEVDILIEMDGGASRRERLRVEGALTVGRTASNTLCLEGDLISRTHVLMELGATALRVEDRSSNGTMAGDVLLRRRAAEVPYGTPIVVGNYTLYVHLANGAAAAPGPPPLPSRPILEGAAKPPPPPSLSFGAPPIPPPAPSFGGSSGPPPIPPPAPSFGGSGGPPPIPSFALAPQAPMPMTRPVPPPVPSRPAPTLSNAAKTEGGNRPTIPAPPPETAANESEVALRREIHAKLLENLDLAKLDTAKLDDPSMRPRVLTALRRIVQQLDARIPPALNRDMLIGELADEALGLGPLERFLADATISEIMVVDPSTIYIEQSGKLVRADARFTDDERVRAVIERIVTPLGRRIDESSPLVDARLKDGSRVNAVIKPLALKGSCITIRKFAKTPLTLDKLVGFGALTDQMGRFLTRSVICKKNIIISGGTGSGKTTLLNVLSSAIPNDERIVTIEDAAELQLKQPHVVSLETRPANMEGRGEYTIRDLVRNALRMRPDRIVVGECRGGEALDMLQAMNTGHDGSLTTTHSNSPEEAIARIETLVLMGGVELPSRAIREQIASSLHLVVQQSRFSDGSRRIAAVSEVAGIDEEGQVEIRPIFEFVRTGTGPGGRVLGEHRATGYLPSFLDAFIVAGLVRRGEPYL